MSVKLEQLKLKLLGLQKRPSSSSNISKLEAEIAELDKGLHGSPGSEFLMCEQFEKQMKKELFRAWMKQRKNTPNNQTKINALEKQFLELDPKARKQVNRKKRETPTPQELALLTALQTERQEQEAARIARRNTAIQQGTTQLPPFARKPAISQKNKIKTQGIRGGTRRRRS